MVLAKFLHLVVFWVMEDEIFANFKLGILLVITMIIVLVTTKDKSLGTDFNQENWMLVIWLMVPFLLSEGWWFEPTHG